MTADVDRGTRRWPALVVTAVAAGRAGVGHLTLPLLLVVRGLPFLALVLVHPNEASLAIGAVQVSRGQLPWAGLLGAAVAGAVVADLVSYLLGRTLGTAALERLLAHRHGRRSTAFVVRAQQAVERRGAVAVALARPTVVTHGAIPVLAGVGKLPVGRFTAASMLGAAVWAGVWSAGGTALATALPGAQTLVVVAAAAVLVVGVGLAVCHRRPTCFQGAA